MRCSANRRCCSTSASETTFRAAWTCFLAQRCTIPTRSTNGPGNLPRGRPIAVYCMFGFQVSGGAVAELRRRGFDARSLKGGIAAWHAIGGPTVPLDASAYRCNMIGRPFRVALMWSGDREARRSAVANSTRLAGIFAALNAVGIQAEPAVYADEMADEVREQILAARRRARLGRSNRQWQEPQRPRCAVARGVGARRLGQHASRRDSEDGREGGAASHEASRLGHRYPTVSRPPQPYEEFPPRLQSAGPRVLKQNRGNGGQGVWKVELPMPPASDSAHRSRAACATRQRARGAAARRLPATLRGLLRCRGLHHRSAVSAAAAGGHDPLLHGGDKVVGFGHQLIKALIPPPAAGPDSPEAQPGPRIMHPADAPAFQALRAKMEAEWTPQMMQVLDIDAAVAAGACGMPISSTGRAPQPATTLTCCARSMSAR